MKGISPKPKHLLFYRGKRIYEHIKDALCDLGEIYIITDITDHDYGPGITVIPCGPPVSRKHTLEYIRNFTNTAVIDCDVIPDTRIRSAHESDFIYVFESPLSEKYGGVFLSNSGTVIAAEERSKTAVYKASGMYLLKNVGETLDRMTDENSLASSMIGAKAIVEKSFIRLGDQEDYMNAL